MAASRGSCAGISACTAKIPDVCVPARPMALSGSTFNVPTFNPNTKKVYKCTLCSDSVGAGLEPACIKACPTGCLHFGTKEDRKFLAENRASQLREASGFQNAGVYDPAGVGGTHVMYVLHDIEH